MERGEAQGKVEVQNPNARGDFELAFLICLELWALSFELGGVRASGIEQ